MTSRKQIVSIAQSWIGTPYHHQACVKGEGCDCLGLIRGVWRELYGNDAEHPPPYTQDWAEARRQDTLIEAADKHLVRLPGIHEAEPGDVLIFRLRPGAMAKHAAILSRPGRMIHGQEGVGVVEVNMGTWWVRRVDCVFRFPGHDEGEI